MDLRVAAIGCTVWFTAATGCLAEQTLTLSFGSGSHSFTQSELLARSDARDITVPADVAYGRAMHYRAVPALGLLEPLMDQHTDTIEARATDGFVSQIPRSLFDAGRTGGSTPWIAIENPDRPWPNLPKKDVSAGPFFLVWLDPRRSNVSPEQWPYALGALTGVEHPERRWPALALDASLPADAPERLGLAAFVKNCLACHKLNGAGEATVGPDLGLPMSPTVYLTPEGLRLVIRNSSAVRTWPDQKMPPFDEETLPEADLHGVVAYLTLKARPN